MAKTTKTKAPKFNATLTIPAITINSKTLLELARIDRCELESMFEDMVGSGSEDYLTTPEVMLQNPQYVEYVQKAIVKLFTSNMLDEYGCGNQLTQKQVKTIFAKEVAAAKVAKKKFEAERLTDLKGSDNTAILKISGHDVERVKMFLNRCDLPFIQIVTSATEFNAKKVETNK